MKRRIVFPLLIILFVGTVLLSGRYVYRYGPMVMLFPMITGIVSIALCFLQMAYEAAPGARGRARTGDGPSLLQELKTLLLIAGILPFLWVFGFVAGPALYLLLWMRIHAAQSWTTALVMGMGIFSLTYGLFGAVLGVSLPSGIMR